MDICHRSNAELEPKLQIERQCRALGPCASQMTVANIMDVFTRLTDCDEQSAVNAVSAYTLVKLEDAPRLQKKYEIRMSRCLDTSSTTRGQNHGETIEDPEICNGIH